VPFTLVTLGTLQHDVGNAASPSSVEARVDGESAGRLKDDPRELSYDEVLAGIS
jgi:hypothetical protein